VASQTNAALTSKVRSTATEIGHQVVNQFISLTSGQIAAYMSKIGQIQIAEHNRYNRIPLKTTFQAENHKSAQSPQQNYESRIVSKSEQEEIAELAKKAEQSHLKYEISSGTSAFRAIAFLSKLIDSSIAKEAKNAFYEQRVLEGATA
jgi:hypothetical protein